MGGIVGWYMVVEVFFYVLTVFFDDMVSEVGCGRVFIAQDMVPDFLDIVFEFHFGIPRGGHVPFWTPVPL